MKRILVITNNLKQASYRLRVEALIEPLAARGLKLEVKVRPRGWIARRRLLRSAGEYDAVVLQRKLLDGWDARLLKRAARRVIFDVDDAVMLGQERAGWLERRRAWRRFVATARNVDHVVAGNEYLAEMFGRQGAQTSVLPTVVDVARYGVKRHEQMDRVTLVWIGSKSTLGYLRLIEGALSKARQEVAELRLMIIADVGLVSPPVETEFVQWSEAGEAGGLARGDIGIAPTPDNEWTRGKCGFKIVQYMAAGLPVIASPVGANANLVMPGITGLHAEGQEQWAGAIVELARDVQKRARMGEAGRKRAENEFSLQRAVDFWEKLLRES